MLRHLEIVVRNESYETEEFEGDLEVPQKADRYDGPSSRRSFHFLFKFFLFSGTIDIS